MSSARAAEPAVAAADLEVSGVEKAFGTKPALRGATVHVPAGQIIALLGPSGCGKTTLLRVVAGLELPDRGTVRVGGRVLTDGVSAMPPERRHVGMVFQDGALFPHLSVAGNVGYGLPRGQRRGPRVTEALALVGLDGFGDRMPGTLSGGQQQRVALARALAPRPALLLFDEPFSNLDTSLRVRVRAEVHRLLTELAITALFVTHDQEEAFVLGDEVAVMHDGVIVQQAPPADLYARPASPWVAGFVGDANLLAGAAGAGGSRASTALGPLPLAAPARGDLTVLVRPEHLVAFADGDTGDASHGVVDTVEQYGHDAIVAVRLGGGELVKARLPGVTPLRAGDAVAVRYTGGPTLAWPVDS